jgi:hypothetical protein
LETQTSYQSLVLNRFYKVNANSLVAGVLTAYDLQDLIASLVPRKCAVLRPRNHLDEPFSMGGWKSSTKFAFDAYAGQGSSDQLRIISGDDSLVDVVAWCWDDR